MAGIVHLIAQFIAFAILIVVARSCQSRRNCQSARPPTSCRRAL